MDVEKKTEVIPLKRSSSEAQNEDFGDSTKRRRYFHHHTIQHKQTQPADAAAVPQDESVIDALLTRSIGVVLETVGFAGADSVAIESFRLEVDEYIQGFLSSVTQSMLSCRRAQPIPQDFEHALRKHNILPSFLIAHLDPPVSTEVSQPNLSVLPPVQQPDILPPTLFGEELDGAVDKSLRSYIPSHFPPFPSKHTYNSTPAFTDREKDARRIRERATEEGRLGEEALRRLVGASKGGAPKTTHDRISSARHKRHKDREDMWRKTLDLLANNNNGAAKSLDESGMNMGAWGAENSSDSFIDRPPLTADQDIVVNSERSYWRKAVAPAKSDSTNDSSSLSQSSRTKQPA
ncbi:hypothetical protein L228DRAFT_251468 [Xylona heveae TC161]|uniref:Transcription initiation factor TFIID subunit 8 n=1 Tax=Xylona heveae (strain CBS 132557 / TC161) TaxID=1328760 RepID=A0A164ZCP1_XYLHT|nr:hypothetical protein L228DRAFT_251468 [Xylona heveae TC161]KZF18939.1 hypothetical protein L228DRAFT_251468 [Xylona heveae TC161]